MKTLPLLSLCFLTGFVLFSSSFVLATEPDQPSQYTMTKEKLENMTPHQALKHLIEGNHRFLTNNIINRNILAQKKFTSKHGQYPAALVLSCMDSRGVPEVVFDQAVGDIFTVRLAGNVIDKDQLGGMEFATKIVGTKLIVVMGHTQCGAVIGACSNVKLGNLTQLLNKIKPAVEDVKSKQKNKISCDDAKTIDKIAKQNVLNSIKQIKNTSPVVRDLLKNNKIMIVGAMHHLDTGKVDFFDGNGKEIH